MPQSNTQSYINGGANVRARASDLASSPEQRSKAATRFASRWKCSGDVAQRAAAALVTESGVLGEFDPAVLAFKTDEERAAAREKDRGRRDKKTRRTLIGLLRVVEGWARVVLGRDEACVWRAVRAPESRAAAWLGFARCCWGVAGRLLHGLLNPRACLVACDEPGRVVPGTGEAQYLSLIHISEPTRPY